MYGTGTINVNSMPTNIEHNLYEDRLKELYAEIDRLDFQVEIITKKLRRVISEELTVETKSENIEKQNPVPLLRDMINIMDRITIATNRIMFLGENVVI